MDVRRRAGMRRRAVVEHTCEPEGCLACARAQRDTGTNVSVRRRPARALSSVAFVARAAGAARGASCGGCRVSRAVSRAVFRVEFRLLCIKTKVWRMRQTACAAPASSTASSRPVCRPGTFMHWARRHARCVAGQPSLSAACSGADARGLCGDFGGAVRPSRETERRVGSSAGGVGGGGGGGSGGGRSLGGIRGTSGCCMGKPAGGSKASPGSEAELKALTHSVLKRIKEKQLEGLLQAVESRGGARSPACCCPGKVDAKLGTAVLLPPAAPLQGFPLPDLRHGAELKRLPGCESYGKVNPELVCCNPHHMSRLSPPPPPYSRYPVDFLNHPFDRSKSDRLQPPAALRALKGRERNRDRPEVPTPGPSGEGKTTDCTFNILQTLYLLPLKLGGTIHSAPVGFSDSQALLESGERGHWCVVAYWEEKTRVGRLYSVQESSLDIFYDLPQGTGFCLGQLASDSRSQLVQMVRAKIGYGIQLSREADGVWVYNRSCYPIFIKSATLDNPASRTLLVHKVFPGFSIKAFDYEKANSLQRPNDHEFSQQPRTGFTVQISFVKGWGQCYTRQFISSCPCWLEVIFNNR
ncbi:hypothetical protein AOLI_G00210780 [Acnodon oligacanthus]